MRHTTHISCDGGALTGNLVLFLVDSCIPARQWTDICNTRCSILSRFSHIHVSHFPPLQHGAAFSYPAVSCLAFSASPGTDAWVSVLLLSDVFPDIFGVHLWRPDPPGELMRSPRPPSRSERSTSKGRGPTSIRSGRDFPPPP